MVDATEKKKMYALFEETSDQHGTAQLVGIYDESAKARSAGRLLKGRNYIQIFNLNQLGFVAQFPL